MFRYIRSTLFFTLITLAVSLFQGAGISWSSYGSTLNLEDDDLETDDSRILTIYNTFLQERSNQDRKYVVSKKAGSGFVAVTASSFLFFLGKNLSDDLTDTKVLGYPVGLIAQVPITYIIYQLTNGEIQGLEKMTSSTWKKIKRNDKKAKSIANIGLDALYYGITVPPAAIATYYTQVYLEPIMGRGVYFFQIPVTIGQLVLGKAAMKKLVDFLYYQGIDRYLLSNFWSREKKKRKEVQGYLMTLINKVNRMNQEEVEDYLDAIKNGAFTDQLEHSNAPPEQNLSNSQVVLGLLGSAVGGLGAYAVQKATAMSLEWLLINWFDFEEETAYEVGNACGWFGFAVVGSLKALGTRKTLQKQYSSLKKCSEQSKKQIATDSASGVLSLISTSSRVKIVLDTNIDNMGLRSAVIACNIIGTSATDYYGWKGLMDRFIHGRGKRNELVRELTSISNDIPDLDFEIVDAMYNIMKED